MSRIKSSGIDPTRIPDSAWEPFSMSADGLRRTSIAWIDREAGTYVLKTENLIEDTLIKTNQDEFNDSYGRRFGDIAKVASIPLNKFYEPENIRHFKEGDKDYLKWFLNHEKTRPWRTFRGTI